MGVTIFVPSPLGSTIEISEVETLTKGVLIVGDGSGAPGQLTVGANDTILTADSGETTGAKWSKVGGTSIEMGSDAQGDILYHNGTSYVRLGAGTDGQYLETNGAGANPSWTTVSAGGDYHSGRGTILGASFDSSIAGTWAGATASDKFGNAVVSNTTNAQNDEVRYAVPLMAGTYTIHVIGVRATTQGIAHVQFDDTEKGTIDYYGATAQNHEGTITSISVAAAGTVNIDFKMETKNASSSGYQMTLNYFWLERTGA